MIFKFVVSLVLYFCCSWSLFAAPIKKNIKPKQIEAVSLGHLSRLEIRHVWAKGIGIECLDKDFTKLPENKEFVYNCLKSASKARLVYFDEIGIPESCLARNLETRRELTACWAIVGLKSDWSTGRPGDKTTRIEQIIEWTDDIPRPGSMEAMFYLRRRGELMPATLEEPK